MDQIFDRLERLIKSWTTMDDGDTGIGSLFRFGSGSGVDKARKSGDPDLDAAMSELDEFLGSSRTETEEREHREAAERSRKEQLERERQERGRTSRQSGNGFDAGGASGYGSHHDRQAQSAQTEGRRALEEAYRILDLPYGVAFVDVKVAYKRLLKKHHPDLNAQTEESLKRATALSSRINVAYQMIEAWEQSGRRTVG